MRVFLTGATGLIGSALVPELIHAGHQVLGLTRSDAGARALMDAGAEVRRGVLEDLDGLREAAAAVDAVIHCAFEHDFSRFKESSDVDRRAIEALGDALAGSHRPFLVSSGIPLDSPVHPVTEDVAAPAHSPAPRVSEQTALGLVARGVRAGVVRVPQVHNTVKQGLVTSLIEIARQKGVSAYVGEGLHRWSAAHVTDVARVYRLALEKGEAGDRHHAVGEEGVTLKDIAQAIGRGLKVPVVSIIPDEADAHFGFFGKLVRRDLSASSAITQRRLGWQPGGPGLIDDIDRVSGFADRAAAPA